MSEIVFLATLIFVRVGIPLAILFGLGSLLGRWDSRRTDA